MTPPALAFYRYFRDVTGLVAETSKPSGRWELAQSAGCAPPHADICWVSERYHVLARDERGRLHGETGPACAYPDGFAIYALHDVEVPRYLVERPQDISVERIDGEPNAEVRRVMIERYRAARKYAAPLLSSATPGPLGKRAWHTFRGRYPRIVFHLVIAGPETLLHELRERNVDLLITRRWGPTADERLDFEFLFDDLFVVAAGALNPWVRRRRIALAELVNESWALPPPEGGFGLTAMEAFRSCGLDYPRTTVVTTPPDVRMSLLATGHFLTIFPASALRFPTRRLELKVLPVELPMGRVPNGIVTLKNRTLSPVAHLFIDRARKLAKLVKRKW